MSNIIAALIGALGTVISTIGLYYLKRWHDDNRGGDSARDRQAALTGTWTGSFAQTFNNEVTEVPIKAHLGLRGRKYTGTVEYTDRAIKLNVDGWFLDNSIFRLDYRDNNLSVIRHGCTLLQLSPDARSVEGNYVGYNPEFKAIVTGFIRLEKLAGP